MVQVPHEGQFLSCCAVVQGCQQNLFVVPRPEVLGPHAEELQQLATEAAADPSQKAALLTRVHVSSGCPQHGPDCVFALVLLPLLLYTLLESN